MRESTAATAHCAALPTYHSQLEIEDYALTVVLPARAAVTSVDVRGLPKPSVTVSADPPSVEVTSARIVSGSMGSESPHAGAIAVTFNLP